jgi:hypothetical protein
VDCIKNFLALTVNLFFFTVCVSTLYVIAGLKAKSRIFMSSPQPLPYEFWAPADDWRPGHVMLAANIDFIPSPLPQTIPVVRVDNTSL